MSIVFYAIDSESNIIHICEGFWYSNRKDYASIRFIKRCSGIELTSIEKEMLAMLKLSPPHTSIKGVGRVGHNKYYVVKEHQE